MADRGGRKLTNKTRAAAVIVSLGADEAAEVYKYLREEEIEQLSLEVAKMEALPPEELKDIIDDFYGLCVTQKVISEGGVDYARDVLEKAFGPQQAANLMERVSKSLRTKAFDFIRKADYKNLLSILQNEHPQTIALILSYARADQASMIIGELPPDTQIDVVQRIANLDRASPDVINLVEATLEKKFGNIVSVDLMELGGVPYVAEIMNSVDRSTEKKIFDELGVKDPELADNIRKLMFVFEDIVYLDDISIQRFLREVDTKDLAVALKAANAEVSRVIFQNMSKRSQESVASDIEYLHNVRMKDVEEAQQRIVDAIRRLEEEGELVISKGGKDEVIA
ncbi:flagellar motor switch protein FliG [Ruminococcaceae bacterium OttesenSCG-928-A11]|nr:flagellar motor switch protein FliG [Ruminococcaceae bacterium OttesenSCG-928-A11]